MRPIINPRCPDLNGRIRLVIIVRLPFQFVDSACRDLGWRSLAEIKVVNFSRNDCVDLDSLNLKRDTISELGRGGGESTKKAISPILELTLGTTS